VFEAYSGTKKSIAVPRGGGGNGGSNGDNNCEACDGRGIINFQVQSNGIRVLQSRSCELCRGSGKSKTTSNYKAVIDIPPGTKNGHIIIIGGQGNMCGGERGDIHIVVKYAPNLSF
jgi:molecular chaperone DnaJ